MCSYLFMIEATFQSDCLMLSFLPAKIHFASYSLLFLMEIVVLYIFSIVTMHWKAAVVFIVVVNY